jgi:hypothetical protein
MCRCLDEEEAVAEAEAGARWRPGCGGWGGGGQGATARAEAGGRRVGRGWGTTGWWAMRAGRGRGLRVSVRRAGGERQVVGAWVRSGSGRRAGRGGTYLSRVRERGAGARGIFLDNQ